MRNLKRVLSLALACVMVIGMMVMTTGAADFADADEITYSEAVTVASTLGIIEGWGDSFYPTVELTRDQGTKLIAYLMLGKEKAEMLEGSGQFTDVTWAAGFAEYCYNVGICTGYTETLFGAADPLSAWAFGKWLLVAMGNDADECGYNGPNYKFEIKSDMKDAGLALAGLDLDATLTREQAAQMLLIALKSGGTTTRYYCVLDTGTTFVTKTPATTHGTFTSPTDAYVLCDIMNAGGSSYVVDDGYVTTGSLMEELYGVTSSRTYDAFGRPCTVYNKTGWTAPMVFMDTPVATYTAAVSESTVYNALGCTESSKTVVGYTDGVPAAPAGLTKGNTTPTIGGNGATVELYKEIVAGAPVYTMVIVNNYLAKVTNVVEYEAATATTAEIDASADFTVYNGVSAGSDLSVVGYLTDEFAEDDYIIVTIDRDADNDGATDSNTVKTAVPATVLSDVTIEKYTKNNLGTAFATITVGDTTYPVASKYEANINAFAAVVADTKLEGTYILYTDGIAVLGTAVYTPAALIPNYAYVSDFEAQIQGSASLITDATAAKAVAEINYMNGTTEVLNFKVQTAAADISTGTYNSATIAEGAKYVEIAGTKYDLTASTHVSAVSGLSANLFEYSVDEDGYLTLNSTASRTVGLKTYGTAAISPASAFTSGAKQAAIGGISGKFANASTVLTTVATNGTVTTYNGYANFPTVQTSNSSATATYQIFAEATAIVYTYTDTTINNILVIGDSVPAAATTGPVAVYVGAGDVTADGQYYNFYVDGKVESYLATTAGASAIGGLSAKDVVSLTLTNGKISAASGTGSSVGVTAIDADYFVDNAGTPASHVFASDVKVFNISETANVKWAADELVVGDTVTYVTKTVAGKTVVAYIFITTPSSSR